MSDTTGLVPLVLPPLLEPMAQSNATEAVAAEPVLPATGCRGWGWDMSWVLGEIQKYSGTCGIHHEYSWMIWETNGIDGNGSGTIFPWVGLPCQAGSQVGTLIHRVFQHSKQRQKSILCIHTYTVIYLCVYIYIIYTYIPVVPHRAVAEVSKIGNL